VAQDSGKNLIRIARIDSQGRNLLAVSQAEMRPGLAGVGRFVNAVADREIGPVQSFTARHVENVGIGGSHCDGADRLRRFMIEDRIPRAAVVVGLPHSAVHLADVEHIRLARNARGCAGASAAKRADHPPVQLLVGVFWNLRPTGGCGKKTDGRQKKTEYSTGSVHSSPST